MRAVLRLLDLWAITVALLCAQSRFPMRYLDEVGHLDGLDTRKFADLGFAKIFPEPDGMLRIEGEDDAGKPWRMHLPPGIGISTTDIWSADFDRNGRGDLLIAANVPGNGRCIDHVVLTFLLFDGRGRPMPWRVQNQGAGRHREQVIPAILLVANHTGRAQLVTTGCEYSDPWTRPHGEDRRITGVYEAHNAHWLPVRDGNLAAYQRVAVNTDRRTDVKWLSPGAPDQWFDQLRGIDDAPSVKLLRLIPMDPNCHGVNIPLDIENGLARLRPGPNPCFEAANHASYSDGPTLRGWPPVVIDSPAGREIYIPSQDGDTAILDRVIREGWRLKRLGNPATPDWLWVERP